MDARAPLTLYRDAFWESPYDCSCYVALREKRLDFTTALGLVREGLGPAQAVRANSVIGRIPSLQHGEFWLSESMAIVEYLEDVFPPPAYPPLLPPDPRDRARARQVMLWIRSALAGLRRARPSYMIFYPSSPSPLDAEAQRDADELLAVAARLLARGPRPFGAWSIAEVDLAFVLMRLLRTGHPLPDPLRAFAEETFRRPSVLEFVEHPRPPHPPQ